MTRTSLLAGILGALTLASACARDPLAGGGFPDLGVPPPDLTVGDIHAACATWAKANCARFTACIPFNLALDIGDEPTCRARQTIACLQRPQLVGSTLFASQLEACAQALDKASCPEFLVGSLEACAASPGTFAPGASCSAGAQCSTGFCARLPTASCGTCTPRPQLGDTCDPMIGCGRGMVCSPSKRCVRFVGTGASCDAEHPCDPTVFCFGAKAGGSGICTPLVAQGQPCDPDELTTPRCDVLRGLLCDEPTRTCRPIQLAASGDPCGTINGVFHQCGAGGFCRYAPGASTGNCVAPAVEGAACDLTKGPRCLFPAGCIEGRCSLVLPSTCS